MNSKTTPIFLYFAIVAWYWIPLRYWLEQSMSSHLLIEYPLLILMGWQLARFFPLNFFNNSWNRGGVAGILFALFTLMFWMIPRWMEASIETPILGMAKSFCLAICVGAVSKISWDRLHSVVKALLIIELLTTFIRIGWIYSESPVRVCNSYKIEDQQLLGSMLIFIAALIFLYFTIRFFLDGIFDKGNTCSAYESNR